MTRLNAKSSNRTVLLIGTVIAAVLIALVVFAVRPAGSASSGTKTFDLTGQPVLGQASARVTVVVFEDFKCPNCKRFEEETFPVIQSKYIDTGKVRFSMLPFPFIAQQNSLPVDDSKLAAEAGLCAFDQKPELFWTYTPIIFRAQGPENQVWASKARLVELAGNVDGIDTVKLRSCLDAGTNAAKVDTGEAQATKAGVNGTPSVFVNGVLTGDYSAVTVSAAINRALK